MRNFVIGFFMAWGNFLTIPCPYKRWDSSLKNVMLAFLPSVGAVLGLVWIMAGTLLYMVNAPLYIAAFVMVFLLFFLCGFMHMDGFMDCNDAILSRRPLEDRQRILKDSTVGAFAVVTLAFLVVGWYAVMRTYLSEIVSLSDIFVMGLVPVMSRGIAALFVLGIRPMGTSQYAEDYDNRGKGKLFGAVIVQLAIYIAAIALITGLILQVCVIVAVVAVCECIACGYGVRNLGGMSGDIAGYSICLGEFFGMMGLAVFCGYMFM